MSGFHGQRLRQLRARAGLDPLPKSIYAEGFIPGFEESIDPRFYSPAARHWYDKVSSYVQTGNVLPASEREAFAMVGGVLNMARDERDERKRRECFMPSAASQRRFDAIRFHRAVEAIKSDLLVQVLRQRGYNYGPDYEFPDDVELPSADGLFDRAMAEEFRQSIGAVKQKRLRWRSAYRRSVRISP